MNKSLSTLLISTLFITCETFGHPMENSEANMEITNLHFEDNMDFSIHKRVERSTDCHAVGGSCDDKHCCQGLTCQKGGFYVPVCVDPKSNTGKMGAAAVAQFSPAAVAQFSPAAVGQVAPATGGQVTPTTGGQVAPATGGQVAPATGGKVAPVTGGQVAPAAIAPANPAAASNATLIPK